VSWTGLDPHRKVVSKQDGVVERAALHRGSWCGPAGSANRRIGACVLASVQATDISPTTPTDTLTPGQVALVQSSFQDVLPLAETAGVLLYERIFALAPATRALFGDDIRPQAARLMAAVKTAVEGLDDLDAVAPFLVKLGARHVRYGVRPEHFDVGGEALLWTLAQGLGEAFTAEVREAWTAAWTVIVGALTEGMSRVA
jgi:hemoglobin-like flavoprotein